ncbi:TIGR02679 family protein [Streptacidiphilus sp. PAMC 29251]
MDLPRLRRMLGGPDTAWLLDRVRERIADGQPLDTPVVLTAATAEQRQAVQRLLGRRPGGRDGQSLSVPLAELDRMLRESEASPDGLAAAVVALTGPVQDRRAQRAADTAAWQAALAPLDGCRAALATEEWRTLLQSSGLLRRLAGADPSRARELTEQCASVLQALPTAGTTLAVLAARSTGDAHALDPGRPLATLVRSAVRSWAALPDSEATGADGRRTVWAAVGVAVDELSSRVLTLGLPGGLGDTTGRILAAAAEGGEPCVLTLRQLTQTATAFGVSGRRVFLCENPAVVAEAARTLGSAAPPLVCVEGSISVAARVLLPQLTAQGGLTAYHGDFDWGGIRIATDAMRLTGARPWRFTRADYLAALARGLGTPLATGTPAPTPWDPGLADALSTHRVRVEEEHLLDHLLADLQEQV